MPSAPKLRIVIDGAAMDKLLTGVEGPVVRYLSITGDAVIAAARPKIRRRAYGPIMAGAGAVSLQDSMVKRFATTSRGPTMTIQAMKPYAYWVHEGNTSNGPNGRIWPTHSMNSKGGPAVLAFPAQGGAMIFVRSVKVSTPNPFLRDAMNEVVGIVRV